MRLYFIRHGKTSGNQEHRYVGRTDEGILESEKERLRKKIPLFPEMDMVFVSPYLRCRQTVEILFPGHLGKNTSDFLKRNESEPGKWNGIVLDTQQDGKRGIEIINDFREMDFGEFEYKNYQELEGNPDYQKFIDSGGTMGFPGGEGLEDFKERCRRAFRKCIRKAWENGWQQVGFVVHGGTIMAILESFSYPKKEYYEYQVGNGCGYVMDLEEMAMGENISAPDSNIKLKMKEKII